MARRAKKFSGAPLFPISRCGFCREWRDHSSRHMCEGLAAERRAQQERDEHDMRLADRYSSYVRQMMDN